MKRIAFLVMATLLFTACKKEEINPTPQPQPEPTPTVSLAGTSWVGSYDDNYMGYPATLTWTLDFLTDSTGSLHFDMVIATQPQPSFDDPFHYTLNGTMGALYSDDLSDPKPFTYDSIHHTITMELGVGNGTVTLGGVTVFYPQGEMHDLFPVNTSWEAEQQLTVSDTTMSVQWGLDFWEDGWGGQVNYCANGTCAGTSFFWQYDSTAHSGTIRINSATYPFTYDPATDIITLDYSTNIYGTNITIGGTLQFHQVSEQVLQQYLHTKAYQHHSGNDICRALRNGDVALAKIDAKERDQQGNQPDERNYVQHHQQLFLKP